MAMADAPLPFERPEAERQSCAWQRRSDLAFRRAVAWPAVPYGQRSWRRLAACRNTTPEVFFPIGDTSADPDATARAKAVCAQCPVRADCLQFAIVTNQEYGIWGGCEEDERRVLRRTWRERLAQRS